MSVRSRSVRARHLVVAAALAAIELAALPSCEDPSTPRACSSIPAGGCPLSRGVACEDPACEAVYACRPDNVWELERTCPPRDGGPPPEAAADATEAASDAARDGARSFDASYDGPGAGGGPGCGALQAPDCSLAAALACGAGCCGCEDLFVCESGAWVFYAACRE